MANLNETDEWFDGIYQLEEDDPVLGGPAGIDNLAPRQLASRTKYQRLRSVSPWRTDFIYPAGESYVSFAGQTWKSVGMSVGTQPGSDEAKWQRWGYTEAELELAMGDAVANHEAKPNPHSQYVRHDSAQGLDADHASQARANISAEASGTAVSELQKNTARYAADTGAPNALVAAFVPAIAALNDGMVLWVKAKAANTGATTFNAGAGGPLPVVGAGHAPLQGGEIVANGRCELIYSATLTGWVLRGCTGGAAQTAPATQSQHAVQLGQFYSLEGTFPNAEYSLTSGVVTLNNNQTIFSQSVTITNPSATRSMRVTVQPTGARAAATSVLTTGIACNIAAQIFNGASQLANFATGLVPQVNAPFDLSGGSAVLYSPGLASVVIGPAASVTLTLKCVALTTGTFQISGNVVLGAAAIWRAVNI